MANLEEARELDRSWSAIGRRSQFELPAGLTYLDGNSLGPPLRGLASNVAAAVAEWSTDLISGWFGTDGVDGWMSLPERVGSRLEPILGAGPGTVVACDSTTVNLYKTVQAACDLSPGDLLTDSGNFPTNLYALAGIARSRGRRLVVVEPESIEDAIDSSIGVVSLTQVDYRSGRLHDLASITRMMHEEGGLSVWDLSHSAGAMPIDLASNEVDLAVGCGYKYLNGGPGAPAYVYVRPDLIKDLRNPIAGWFGHIRPFDFSAEFLPAEGVGRMRVGTPHILSMVALDAALAVFADVDLAQLRSASQSLTGFFIELVDRELGPGVEVITPRDPDMRGSQVSLRHPNADTLIESLAGVGVVGDFRNPDVARFGLSALYNTHEEVARAIEEISGALRETGTTPLQKN
jgi:kynureninase